MSTIEVVTQGANEVEALEAGLDSLTATRVRNSSGLKRIQKQILAIVPSILAVAFLLFVWTALVHFKVRPSSSLPSPIQVGHSAAKLLHEGILWKAVGNSLRRAALGFLASVIVGTVLGLTLVRFRLFRLAIGPIISGLQSLPSVAWVPAAIIWFGVNDEAVYTVVLFGAVPSIATGLHAGVRQIPPLYVRVGQIIGARGFGNLRFIVLPAALPSFFAGLRQGWAFSWRALMAAELITSTPGLGNSLGQLLQSGKRLSNMSLVLTAIILILVVGVGIESLVFGPIERRILRTRGLSGDS